MLTSILLLLVGLAALALGADWLLRGSVGIAERLKVPKVIIGLTVVALGTSAPELITAIHATLQGQPGIVLGNAVGSNIANLGLVLGVGALISRIPVDHKFTWRDGLLMVVVTILCFVLARDGLVSRLDGLWLVLCLAPLAWFAFHGGTDETTMIPTVEKKGGALLDIALLIGGLAGLAFGARWLVSGAVSLAQLAGISGTLVGATVVAFGTSAPELAATIAAARRRHYDIMLGNLVGSCQLNLAMIIGVPAMITPLEADNSMLLLHLPALLITSLFAWMFMFTSGRVIRREGAVMLLIYIAYIALGILLR